jgi:hypothetical protein
MNRASIRREDGAVVLQRRAPLGTLLLVVTVATLPLGAAGCGGGDPLQGYVSALCNCEGCNDQVLSTTQEEASACEKIADNLSCGGELNDLVDCASANSSCVAAKYITAASVCSTQVTKFKACMGNNLSSCSFGQ